MPRPRSDTPKTEQVNVRLTAELATALDIIAALDGVTAQHVIREFLEAKVAEYAADEDYQALLRIRERRRAQRLAQEAEQRRRAFGVVDGTGAS